MATFTTEVSLQMRARDLRRCVRCLTPASLERHHRRRKNVLDQHTHCTCNGIHLCGWGNHTGCHGWVHSNPEEARRQGWIVSAYGCPCEVPVFTQQHGWILLGCDGTVYSVKGATDDHHPDASRITD